ncbi:O-succinylhomoserine (thiol)-lyase [Vibrio parahaemolyticus]|jgi:cystathionine gamma-synthase|uniref:O-succinylhomoserine (thiol)-lyase n=1 Tax=Vibrio parahaemolyticus TaxID=670 RepID=UPI00046EB820|nr:O-succinylhomoserine (thiol)-lyase [Vibrio parahaemolyticus]EHK0753307.1 O-succinylhomoserine (thiol)-lyase [Vibrio parahaemolyticus]EJE4178807.1 O-succinylhomoserine (thiol)-lyase [Vibrio parahaemolyticus]MCR9783699.1 O-succinylhomoserine (thiol)-lyase [Vibrio parahaemolyticus]MDF4651965.1 O-succinylhomoserine (thiol)-lyase [Vibrio parahaemolyticus]MDG3033957.1 O-succinylhomoserine (thiol)-lyase [Vibrio parahaemolyticus]
MSTRKPATIAVRTGIESDSQYHAVVPPIYLSTNYGFPAFGEVPKYDYTRSGNPNRGLLESALSELESGKGAVVTNCGTSALNLWVSAFLGPDDLIVAPHDCYGGTYRLFNTRANKGDFKVQFVDQSDEQALEAALAKKPKLILLETPSNPLVRVVDIAAVCEKAKQVGALVAVDNTFLTPVYQKPLELGADFVIHSTTKYINGHSDVIGGVVITKTEAHAEELAWWGNCIGATGTPFDSYMTLRGIRTLGARMRVHEESSQHVLNYLQQQALVAKIYHPSLPDHPGHEIAKKQQSGFGSMLSFEFAGSFEHLKVFVKELELFSLAESLGGVESLICHPASMTHRAMGEEALAEAGVSHQLLRLSVGLEDAQDLIADLDQAFVKAAQ